MARRGDRASMREGPLAALFRKTEEDAPAEQRAAEPPKPTEEPRAEEPRAEEPRERPVRPHPSLIHPSEEGRPEPEPEEPERRIPTPQERLRHAFSSDIPENVMAPPPEAPSRAPQADPYARSDAPPMPTTRSFGEPTSSTGAG